MEEKIFYHALATRAAGDYGSISRIKHGYSTWQQAYQRTGGDRETRDPKKEYAALSDRGIALILFGDPLFPPLLREIPHPPFGIYIKGTPPDRDQLSLAIIGTRRATPDGKSTARRFAANLARAGIAVVSGGAFGIDTAAHEGCLDAGGKTVAVLACGLGSMYPRNNEPLANRILANGGALISEYPPDQPAYPSRFLERNRIVSGLAKGALVIEAPERSGSLATARFALEQNRDVFVIPGPIAHPHFKGSHALIRQGAELVTDPEDILASYGIMKASAPPEEFAGTPEERIVCEFLFHLGAAADIDKITEETKLEPRIASQTVSALFIKGIIRESGDGYMIH